MLEGSTTTNGSEITIEKLRARNAELLEALKLALPYLEEQKDQALYAFAPFYKARAAIAKATRE